MQYGGMERVASILSEEWAKKYDVFVCVFNAKNQAYPVGGQLIDLAIPEHTSIWTKIYRLFHRILSLSSLFRKIKPEFIVSFCVTANLPTIWACVLSGYTDKLSISVHANLQLIPKLHQLLMTIVYRIPNRLLAVSATLRLQLATQLRLPLNVCHFVPNPIDLDLIAKQKMVSIPEKYADIGRIIIAVGRLHAVKGYDRLIEAFAIVSKTYPGKLVILGEGDERQRLESIITGLGLNLRVLMPGAVNNPFAWMTRADALVLSSHSESWGMVILESFACECPVVSFDCETGPREIIENRINGLLVKNGDILGLANAITEVTNNSELRGQLIRNGLKCAKKYSVSEIAPLWLG